jgi:dTDP-glucose 4,6-dehydratase
MPNIELVGMLCDLLDRRFAEDGALAERFPKCPAATRGRCRDLISFVKDRPGHDRRYAICADKVSREFGFQPTTTLSDGLATTVDWYLANESWWRPIQSGEYRNWIHRQYGMAG